MSMPQQDVCKSNAERTDNEQLQADSSELNPSMVPKWSSWIFLNYSTSRLLLNQSMSVAQPGSQPQAEADNVEDQEETVVVKFSGPQRQGEVSKGSNTAFLKERWNAISFGGIPHSSSSTHMYVS